MKYFDNFTSAWANFAFVCCHSKMFKEVFVKIPFESTCEEVKVK